MRKTIASLLFILSCFLNAQQPIDSISSKQDSIIYAKTTNLSKERFLDNNLSDKYSGKDFEYIENAPKQKENTSFNLGILQFFVFFMSKIFPFLLGGFIVFVILKSLLGIDIRFWKKEKTSKRNSEKLIYEDENIDELDLETLLENAIVNKQYRLAIRYYYLTSLRGLSHKKIIDYHKEKTNSEYLFEIENLGLRTEFSYLSYVYNYVWYGEFFIDEANFKVAANKYQSFIKSLS